MDARSIFDMVGRGIDMHMFMYIHIPLIWEL